jgi:hypothetical protein
MECVYLDLGGGDRWDYWKLGVSRKIFGWKLGVSRKIFGLKLEKYGYLWDYKDWVWTGAGLRPFAHLYILRHFIPFALIMVLVYATIHILSVRLYRF